MVTGARGRGRWIICWLGCWWVAGCALFDKDKSALDLQRHTSEQQSSAPVVPVPSAESPVAAKPSSTVSPSPAHLTTGLRSANSESNLEIVSSWASKEPPSQARPISLMRQERWNGTRLTWEQARDRLQKSGVTWLQLELHDGVWQLQCSIPNSQDCQKVRFYEAQASDELGAMRAVLEKIDGGI